MKKITLDSIINMTAPNSINPGDSLSTVGKFLGTPEWWDFGNSDPFSGLLGYGDFQFELVAIESRIEISRIGLELWEPSEGEPVPKRHKIKIAKGIKVDLSGYTPGMPLDELKRKLMSKENTFSEEGINDGSDVKVKISIGDRVNFLFFHMEGSLSLAEIQFYS